MAPVQGGRTCVGGVGHGSRHHGGNVPECLQQRGWGQQRGGAGGDELQDPVGLASVPDRTGGGHGAAAMAIPVAHIATLAADFAVLLRKTAVCAWGIGHKLCAVVEAEEDLAIILGLWSGRWNGTP